MNLETFIPRRGRFLVGTGVVTAMLSVGLVSAAWAILPAAPTEAADDVALAAAITPTRVTHFDHADPAAIQYNGVIYSYATDGSNTERKIPVIRASSPTGPYTQLGKALDRIPWAVLGGTVMGPHVIHRGGTRFHMYFTANPRDGGDKCIGVATSTTGPTGPFVPRDHPLACDDAHNGAIAPSFFQDPRTGRNYLLYKTNGPDAIRRIYLQGLGPDGLAKEGGRTLLGERTWNWENPQIIYSAQSRKYFLFTSRDPYRSPDYKTTVNWSGQVDGPYPIDRAHAMMTRYNTSVAGPASAELVKLDNGQTMAFFHGWAQDGGECDRPRFMFVATINWGVNGDNPHLAVPRPGDAHC